jgi:hypothetical protein
MKEMAHIEDEDDGPPMLSIPTDRQALLSRPQRTPRAPPFEVTGDRGETGGGKRNVCISQVSVPEREWNATYKEGLASRRLNGLKWMYRAISPTTPDPAGLHAVGADRCSALGPWRRRDPRSSDLECHALSSWLDRMVDVPVDETLFHEMLQKSRRVGGKTGRGTTLTPAVPFRKASRGKGGNGMGDSNPPEVNRDSGGVFAGRWGNRRPRTGLVLGSGLGPIAGGWRIRSRSITQIFRIFRTRPYGT